MLLRRLLHYSSLALAFAAALPARAGTVDDLVNQTWLQVESRHFRVVTDQPEAHARLMVTDLENLRHISSRVRGAESLEGPPLTVLAMNKENLARVGMPSTLGGLFQRSRTGYAALAGVEGYTMQTDESNLGRSVLLHEYHHFLMHLAPETVSYPKWYDEGMAEYWSSLTVNEGRAWFGHPVEGSHREGWLTSISGAVVFDTATLFNTTKLEFEGSRRETDDVARFYAQARYAIHYFNSTPELRAQLARYLQLHNRGYSQNQAVRIAFARDYKQLDIDMRRYVQRKPVARGFAIGKEGLDLPAVEINVKRLDRLAIHAVLAQVLPRFTKPGSPVARELLATNLRLHPDDPDAYAAAVVYGAVSDAGTRVPDLLARHPNHARLLALRGEMLRMGATAQRATGGAGWEKQLLEARALLRRAIVADGHNALAYHGLGHMYEALPDSEPVEEGIVCLDTAVIYEPQPASFQLLARLYLRDGQLAMALKSMRSAVAFGTASGADRPFDVLMMENLELLADFALATGKDGGIAFKSNSTYTGATRDGKAEGHGKWLRTNGSYYEGAFAAGLPSGQGRLVSERGIVYEGEFAAGVARGAGRIRFAPGSQYLAYEGRVDYGMPSGAGVLTTTAGKLQSTFAWGQAHGSGSFTPARAATPISGTWLYGEYDWPAEGDTVFTGGINAAGQRHGTGMCRDGARRSFAPCEFNNGNRVAASAGK